MEAAVEQIVAKPSLPSQQLADLVHLKHLLHLAHHRNRNQHRRAAFYRSFMIFRRHLGKIVDLYTSITHIPDTHAARHRKKAEDRASVASIQAELTFLARVQIPRCERAFSQLVADLRFGVLGVVLTAILAQSCRILGITAHYEDLAEKEIGKVLQQFEREEWGTAHGDEQTADENVDLGEVVKRDVSDMDVDERDLVQQTDQSAVASPPEAAYVPQVTARIASPPVATVKKRPALSNDLAKEPKKKKPKKKKSGGDALDDLFAGL